MPYPIAGAQVYASYAFENVFASEALTNKAFSHGVKISTFDVDNSTKYIYGLGSQDATARVHGEFKGNIGLEFPLGEGWWLRGILGGSPTIGGAGPYTWTWTVSGSKITNALSGATVDLTYNLDTVVRKQLLGTVFNSMTLTANVDEPVNVKLDGTFANMTQRTSGASLVNPIEDPFNFAMASLTVSGATINDIQGLEMSWNRNVDPVWGLGSRHMTKTVPKQREWNVKLSQMYEQDSDFWNYLIGTSTSPNVSPQEISGAVLTISNGLAGTALRRFVFTFANCTIEKISQPVSVEDPIKSDITLRARNLTGVVMSNNTAAEP